MRSFVLPLIVLSCLCSPALANPHGERSGDQTVNDITLPTKAQIEAAIDEMPDLNAILDDLIILAGESELPQRMAETGETVKERLEASGALEPDRNGLPDIKLTLKVLLGALAEENVSEELSETLSDIQIILKKHTSDAAPSEKPRVPGPK